MLVWVDMTAGAGLIMLDINGISTPSMSSTVFFAVLVIFASIVGLRRDELIPKRRILSRCRWWERRPSAQKVFAG